MGKGKRTYRIQAKFKWGTIQAELNVHSSNTFLLSTNNY